MFKSFVICDLCFAVNKTSMEALYKFTGDISDSYASIYFLVKMQCTKCEALIQHHLYQIRLRLNDELIEEIKNKNEIEFYGGPQIAKIEITETTWKTVVLLKLKGPDNLRGLQWANIEQKFMREELN